MKFIISSLTLDIILVVFVVVMIIIGLKKGVIRRCYDLFATVLSLIGAIFLSKLLSKVIILDSLKELSGIGEVINRFFLFVILLIALRFILFLLGIIIKPSLEKILHKIPLGSTLNAVGGMLLSIIEAAIYSYFIAFLIITPIFTNGIEVIENTYITKHMLDSVPNISSFLFDTNKGFSFSDDIWKGNLNENGVKTLVPFIIYLYDNHVLDQDTLHNLIEEYAIQMNDLSGNIEVSVEEYTKLQEIFMSINKQEVLDRVKVSGSYER